MKSGFRFPYVILFVSSIVVSLFAGTAFTLSWFLNNLKIEDTSKGEVSGAYYAYGNGSRESPFGITNPRHLYNFAWLQFLGTYNKPVDGVVSPTYFELGDDIDMSGLCLPPIGTKDNPFVSSLDGNQHTITNLKVSDDVNKMSIHPSVISSTQYLDGTRLKGAEIIGTFGVIGLFPYQEYDYSVSALDASVEGNVYDLYIDKVKIVPTAENILCGLIAGYVNGQVKYCGVHDSSISLSKDQNPISVNRDEKNVFSNLSEFSLFGGYYWKQYGGNIDWSDKPTPGFGSTLDINEMYKRIQYIANSKNEDWAKTVCWESKSTDGGSYPTTGNALPFVVSNEISQDEYIRLGQSSTAVNKNHEIISEYNIGYMTGSNNAAKINGKKIKDAVNPNSLTKDSNNRITDFKIYSSRSNTSGDSFEFKGLEDSIKTKMLEILNDTSGIIHGFRLSAQVQHNNPITDFIINEKKSILPANALWFVPKEDGVVKVVIDTWDGKDAGFSLYQINRSGTIDSSNPYGNSLTERTVIDKVYKDQNGAIHYNSCPEGSTLVYEADWTRQLNINELYYFEIPVKRGVEYALGNQNGSGPFLVYLDLGQNGGTSSKDGQIHDCDFVRKRSDGTLVRIRNDVQGDYTESGVLLSFVAPTGVLVIYFNRQDKDNNDTVFYLIDPSGALSVNPKVGKNQAELSSDSSDFSTS